MTTASESVPATESAPTSESSVPTRRPLWQRTLMRPEAASILGAVIVFALFMAVAPSFRSFAAFSTVLYASSTIGIMSLAVGLLMIGGEFDLSSGVAVTTGALAATMMSYNWHLNSWTGAVLSLLFAVVVGTFNGVLVMKTGLDSFLITLASFLMLQGLNLAITKWVTNAVSTPSISDMQGFGSTKDVFASSITIGSVSVKITVLWWLVFVAIATYVLYSTRFGNWIFAVGGEFLYIIGAVIGGVSMKGGKGTAIGTAIGAFIFGMINQGIVYAGWNPDWFKFFLGAMLLLAVLSNRAMEKRNSTR